MKRLPVLALIIIAITHTGTGISAASKPAPQATATEVAADGEELTMKLSRRVAWAPAEVLVQMRLEPDSRSRLLSLEWWSDEGIGGSHEISLEGDRSAARQSFSIRHMEAGQYVVSATLKRNDGTQVVRKVTMIVVAKGAADTLVGINADDPMSSGPLAMGR